MRATFLPPASSSSGKNLSNRFGLEYGAIPAFGIVLARSTCAPLEQTHATQFTCGFDLLHDFRACLRSGVGSACRGGFAGSLFDCECHELFFMRVAPAKPRRRR